VVDFLEFAGGEGGDHAQVRATEFAGDGVDVTGNFDGQDYLSRMRRVGQHIPQPAGIYGFQDHFEVQSAILQALLVRVAEKNAHFEKSSMNSSVGKWWFGAGGLEFVCSSGVLAAGCLSKTAIASDGDATS
jgi:hypothetical protein